MAGTIKHSWNGTILTIESDSGISSCDLKGGKGDTGARGPQGAPGVGEVQSVNGKIGEVVLTNEDVGALPDTYEAPVSSVNSKTGAVELTYEDVGAMPDSYAAPVSSVNGKTGAVNLTYTDVGAPAANHTHSYNDLTDKPAGGSGSDGFSPTVSVTEITGGHQVSITDINGTSTFDVMDGADGQAGASGSDGYSPTVSVEPISGGHRVTITDKNGSNTFNVMDGSDAEKGIAYSTTNEVLTGDTWINGKPIYCKVLTATITAIDTWCSSAKKIVCSNVIRYDAIFQATNGNSVYNSSMYYSSSINTRIYLDWEENRTQVRVSCWSNKYTGNVTVIVYYTKQYPPAL